MRQGDAAADEPSEGRCGTCGTESEALVFRHGALLCHDCAWQ